MTDLLSGLGNLGGLMKGDVYKRQASALSPTAGPNRRNHSDKVTLDDAVRHSFLFPVVGSGKKLSHWPRWPFGYAPVPVSYTHLVYAAIITVRPSLHNCLAVQQIGIVVS